MTDEIPSRLQAHYCRTCGLLFEMPKDQWPTLASSARALATSAHALAWVHQYRSHDRTLKDYVSCSRYCEQVAQPEEITYARRLYGDGIPHAADAPSGLKSYAELFPEDDESVQ